MIWSSYQFDRSDSCRMTEKLTNISFDKICIYVICESCSVFIAVITKILEESWRRTNAQKLWKMEMNR